MASPVPCRLRVLMARQADVALILRRGPTRWVELILWDTKKDKFQRGQWFHGRIYDERCDLSPDGTKFIYFASKYGRKRDADMPDTWTAISKPPYFTALALWPSLGTWSGGGMFLDDRSFWRADWNSQIHPRFSVKGLVDVSNDIDRVSSYDKLLNDRVNLQFRHAGWSVIEQKGRRPLTSQKLNPVGKGALLLDCSASVPHYRLVLTDKRAEPRPIEAEWADWDHGGRLLVAGSGKVFAGNYTRRRALYLEELADFNDDRPQNIEAPEWARRW